MTKDDLFKHYIGIIPYRDKDVASYESYAAYARAFLEAAERNFSKRCLQTVRAIASWRETARYDGKTQVSMLDKINCNSSWRMRAIARFIPLICPRSR